MHALVLLRSINALAEIRLDRHSAEVVEVTPLKYAIMNQSVRVATHLLLAGCDVTFEDYLWCELHYPHLLQSDAENGLRSVLCQCV